MVNLSDINQDKKFELFINDASNSFSGWDFSYIETRLAYEPLPWNYASEVLTYLRSVSSALDMGTGGGELLSSLQPFPSKMVASEMYDKNYPIAKAKLEPFGVKVVTYVDKDSLPFSDNEFDLIINRHEYYPPDELYRILKKDGFFITQQVGELDFSDLIEFLDAPQYHEEGLPMWFLENAINQLKASNFLIVKSNESFTKTRFYDIGALAYYLTAIPFIVLNFTTDQYKPKLKEIFNLIEQDGYYDVKTHRFFIIAQKI